jgi:hypothetical protein
VAKTLTAEVARLDEDAQAKFDKFQKLSAKASDGRRAGDDARKLKDEIVALMGDCVLAQLPDGRQVQRVHQVRDVPAKKAYSYEFDELKEIPAA